MKRKTYNFTCPTLTLSLLKVKTKTTEHLLLCNCAIGAPRRRRLQLIRKNSKNLNSK
jgi:hypothetical protein